MDKMLEKLIKRTEDLEHRVSMLEQEKHDNIWRGMNEIDERTNELICNHGEFVDKTTAAQILGVTRQTIYALIADGRLQVGCAGKRVNVYSIAAYLCAKRKGECTA